MSGQAAEMAVGQTMTVRGAVTGYSGTCTYRWYVNGDLKSSTQTYIAGSGLTPGNYRLDLVVVNSDGTRSGSCSHLFSVYEPAQVTLGWDPNAEADLAVVRIVLELEIDLPLLLVAGEYNTLDDPNSDDWHFSPLFALGWKV